MFEEKRYLTVELLASVLSGFTWPFDYTLEDDLPDGIIVHFPKCSLYFSDSPDGDVYVEFLSKDTGGQSGLEIRHAMMTLVPGSEYGLPSTTPGLIDNKSPFASEQTVKDGIHNACVILLTYLIPVISGDFSWVGAYLELRKKDEGWWERPGPAR